MASQAELEQQLAAVDVEIARPERGTAFADRSVQYRPLEDALKARAIIEAALAALAGRSKQTLIVASRGF